MIAATFAAPVRLDFDDYVFYTEMHPDDAFELIDGVIYKLAPEGNSHFQTRSAIALYLSDALDRTRFTPYTEGSFAAPGWADGPRPDNFIARGPWMIDGRIAPRPTADEIALVIEVSSTSRTKDTKRAQLYAGLRIPEFWLVDLRAANVVVYRAPHEGSYQECRTFIRGEVLDSTAVDGLRVEMSFVLQLGAI